MTYLLLDYETFSECDIEERGLDVYASHPTTKALLLAYAFANERGRIEGTVKIADLDNGDDFPTAVSDHLLDKSVIKVAWNAEFEQRITSDVIQLPVDSSSWADCASAAVACSLPGKLAKCCEALNLSEDTSKKAEGRRLIDRFSVPHIKKPKGEEPFSYRLRKSDAEDDWEKFRQYCIQDVVAEAEIWKLLLPLAPLRDMLHSYATHCRINRTGWPVDTEFCEKASKAFSSRQEASLSALQTAAGVENGRSRDQLLPKIKSMGYPFETLAKPSVEATIKEPSTKEELRQILRMRLAVAKTGSSKFDKVLNCSRGSRLRHQYRYLGSRTGRWSSNGVQVQNMPRLPASVKHAPEKFAASLGKSLEPEEVDSGAFLDVMGEISSSVRLAFRAPEGKTLVIGDYSSVENRVLGWITGSQPILDVFKEHLDPYLSFVSQMRHCSYEEAVAKHKEGQTQDRQLAKVAVLGCGFGLGAGRAYRTKDGELALSGLRGHMLRAGIKTSESECSELVNAFRTAYPEVPRFWKQLEAAFLKCIGSWGTKIPVQSLVVQSLVMDGLSKDLQPIVTIKIPSGRKLIYLGCRVAVEPSAYPGGKPFTNISYLGVEHTKNVVEGQEKTAAASWGRIRSYGGKLTENVVQAIARDLLSESLVTLSEGPHYLMEVVGHSHDEIVATVDRERVSEGEQELKAVMETVPVWAAGLPIGAEVCSSERYTK